MIHIHDDYIMKQTSTADNEKEIMLNEESVIA